MSWVAVGVGVVGVGAGTAAGGTSMFGSGPSSGELGRKTARAGIHAYTGALPNQLAFNQQYDPQFAALGSQNLSDMLFGASARTIQVPQYDSRGKQIGTKTVDLGAQRGLIDISGEAADQIRDLSAGGMEQNLANLQANLPEAQAFYQAQNPELFRLRQALAERAQQNLDMGSKIAPEDSYRITSGVRGDWAARGLGASAPAQLDESLQLFGGGEKLRETRTAQAGDIFGALSSTEPDYARFLMSLGDDSAITNAFNIVAGNQQGAFARDFDPLNPTLSGLGLSAAQMQQLADAQKAEAVVGIGGGLMSLGGKLAGGGAG